MTTWEALELALAQELPTLPEYATILWQASGRCVQLQQTRLSLGLAVVSNEYLPTEHRLSPQQDAQLAEWGWEPPEPGDLNWHIEIAWPMTSSEGSQAAALLCRTMRLVLEVGQPGDMAEQRFDASGTDPRRRRRAESETETE